MTDRFLAGAASRLLAATEAKLANAVAAGNITGGIVVFRGTRGTGQAAASFP